jgi:hypothetical protein
MGNSQAVLSAAFSVANDSYGYKCPTPTFPQLGGMFANTLRYYDGKLYLMSTWVNADAGLPTLVLNTATASYDNDF